MGVPGIVLAGRTFRVTVFFVAYRLPETRSRGLVSGGSIAVNEQMNSDLGAVHKRRER